MVNPALLAYETISFREGIERLDQNGQGVLFGVDNQNRLKFVVTDGDIRRAILKKVDLSSPLATVGNKNFFYKPFPLNKYGANKYLKKIKRRHLPLIDENGILREVVILDNFNIRKYDNLIVILAGGLGTRLRPLTETIPKPLLLVGGRPILETIIKSFKDAGFYNFLLSVNYKKEMIEEHFKDGSDFDVNISYLYEDKPLGTAGPLSNIKQKVDKPIIVMNGDLLTETNFEQLLEFHEHSESLATMCVREYEHQIPYGIVTCEGPQLISIEEKPTQKHFVNAGIYVLSPEILKYIPKNEYYDMPTLFKQLINNQKQTSVFPIREYWLDIGRMNDFEKANHEFFEVFG